MVFANIFTCTFQCRTLLIHLKVQMKCLSTNTKVKFITFALRKKRVQYTMSVIFVDLFYLNHVLNLTFLQSFF